MFKKKKKQNKITQIKLNKQNNKNVRKMKWN